MPTQPASLKLDPALTDRIQSLAAARHQSPDTIIREAIKQYLEREEKSEFQDRPGHPSGKPWPQRSPVGGIITPV
jgi:predicted transcriptional regulator